MIDNDYHPELNIIAKNNFGYVGRCPCCGDIQFCIGTVVSFMPEQDFMRLYHSFKRIGSQLDGKIVEMPNGKRIMLRTPVDNFLLSLSMSEFKAAMVLFDLMSVNIQLVGSIEEIENLN